MKGTGHYSHEYLHLKDINTCVVATLIDLRA
jgi:hypothetical protein